MVVKCKLNKMFSPHPTVLLRLLALECQVDDQQSVFVQK